MAHGGGDAGRDRPNFDLPDDILSVIPTDPYDQLDLARKITSMAIASRVTKLETEAGRLRQKLLEKDRRVEELEGKVTQLEGSFQDSEFRLKITLEDNMKLLKERDSLASTVKKLSRDLVKLETFKRQLMQSLNEENSPTETVDKKTYDQSVPKAYSSTDESNGYAKHHSYSSDNGSINDEVYKQAGQKFSITPYITPRFTPTGTPKVISTSVSPRRFSTAVSPQKTSGTTSPINYEGRGSLSSWYPSSQQSSAASSPPRGARCQVALGLMERVLPSSKESFITRAIRRISVKYKGIKCTKAIPRGDVKKSRRDFGMENKDLYVSFQGLLNRNMR